MADQEDQARSNIEDSDESEWEYEYSQDDVESFPVVFDLPIDPVRQKRKRSSRPQAAAPNGTSVNAAVQSGHVKAPGLDGLIFRRSDARQRVQIMGLETRAPMVSFDQQVYECSWGTTIGTDLIFGPPTGHPPMKPLLEDEGVHLLATTRLKLAGTAIQLVAPKESGHLRASPKLPATISNEAPAPASAAEDTDSVPVRLGVSGSSQTKAQASFLENLIAAKLARGENDKVYIGKGKDYKIPDDPVQPRPSDQEPTSVREVLCTSRSGQSSPNHEQAEMPIDPAMQ